MCGGSFITVSPAGVMITGPLVMINSGGAALPGVPGVLKPPKAAKAPKAAATAATAKPTKPKDADHLEDGAEVELGAGRSTRRPDGRGSPRPLIRRTATVRASGWNGPETVARNTSTVMPPAARLTDLHVCPMVTGIVPHVGGPISAPGTPTVLIGARPAACVGDICICVGPPDAIAMGSTTVLIGGRPAARMGDPTVHGGSIVLGLPTVMIG